MEYEFIRDPDLDTQGKGVQAYFSHEHVIVGRWLNDEVGICDTQFNLLFDMIAQIKDHELPECTVVGKEVSLKLTRSEAIIEANSLHHDEPDLAMFSDDALDLDDNGLIAGCGFEDFVAMLLDWQAFVHEHKIKK